MFFSQFLASINLFLLITCLAPLIYGATRLPLDELEALKEIAETLGKKGWDFTVDPCDSSEPSWVDPEQIPRFENAVYCDCSFSNGSICHVTRILLKSQNLTGELPPELTRLPYLQELDLSRNYLNGSLPKEWGSMQLVNVSVFGNRLTGSIPKEFGNISTLVNLTMEFNQLSGDIPEELGNLSLLERLHMTSNYFTGELPETLLKLTALKELRIGENQFTGKIPNFIQNLTNLQALLIQASGFDGPIPDGIAQLTKLSDLRISNLNGTEVTKFPPLYNMKNLVTLILRNCNIIGQLPDYLSKMTNLIILDLSFNKLTGGIQTSFANTTYATYTYLTGNLLTGPIPDWILTGRKYIDLSYNNLSLNPPGCQEGNTNLFGSSSNGSHSIASCLEPNQCSQYRNFLHINCGGENVNVDGTIYEADSDSTGPTKFFRATNNWAISNTGNYLESKFDVKSSFIATNTSSVSASNSILYQNARLSPLSLTYYGFCLQNGRYTVKLHFAEIIFTNDQTFSSLGRRIFDVHVQGKLALKDFNIENEAGGVGKAIIENFSAHVDNNILEIRFYWAGKGTTNIPVGGVYGPLISAISVIKDSENKMSAGIIVGIVVALASVVFVVLGVLWWKGCLRRNDAMDYDLKGLDIQTGSFSLKQIKAATNNFDAANKIGEGGFGSVYKGFLSDGTVIAVKQLSSKSKQGNREFVNEIGMISALQHPHLVKLYGCCVEGNQLLLVYEYMENNSLARALFGPEECQLRLDWPTRHKICIGIARGLAYLHEESRLRIVHRDIKATNVLLDNDLNPKISDFGLAKLNEEENTHISTRIAGTYGYMAPEYAMWGYLTDKADVYSFGIVALEIVCGRSAISYRTKEDSFNLLEWALDLNKEGKLMDLVDSRLGSDFNREEAKLMIDVALLCTNATAAVRPSMSSVVSILEKRVNIQDLALGHSSLHDEEKQEKMVNQFQHYPERNMNQSLIRNSSSGGPWTASTSSSDLYPLNPNSEYWQKRD